MVLRPRGRGRVGRRRHLIHKALVAHARGGFVLLAPPARPVTDPALTRSACPSPMHTRWNRHRRRKTERRKVHAPQPHRRPEARHHQPQAAVHARSRRRHPHHRTTPRWSSSTRRDCSNPSTSSSRPCARPRFARSRDADVDRLPRRRDASARRRRSRRPRELDRTAARAGASRCSTRSTRSGRSSANELPRRAIPRRASSPRSRATASTQLLAALDASAAREPVPLSRGRDQHAVGPLLRGGAGSRDGARAARRGGPVQRRLRDRGVSGGPDAGVHSGGRCTSSGTARSAS